MLMVCTQCWDDRCWWQMLMVYVGIKVTWHSAAWTGPPSQAELTEKTRFFCFRFMIRVYIFTAIFLAILIMIISIVTCRVSIHSVCKGDPCPPQLCWCTSLKVAISITIVKPNEVKISTVMTLLGMKMAGWPPSSSTLLMHRRCVWSSASKWFQWQYQRQDRTGIHWLRRLRDHTGNP